MLYIIVIVNIFEIFCDLVVKLVKPQLCKNKKQQLNSFYAN